MLYQIAVVGREAPNLPEMPILDSYIDDDDALVLTVEVSPDHVSAYEAALTAEPSVVYWERQNCRSKRPGLY